MVIMEQGPAGLLKDQEKWKDQEVERFVKESTKRETERIQKEVQMRKEKQDRMKNEVRLLNKQMAKDLENERLRRRKREI